jgi:hypothetical protein
MRQFRKAAALWTCFSALALSGCGEPKRVVTNIAPPSERLQCEAAGARPAIAPEYKVDWTAALGAPNVKQAVAQAMAEHAKFVASIRTREGLIAGYIVKIEGQLFVCSNNAAWLRDWYAGQE